MIRVSEEGNVASFVSSEPTLDGGGDAEEEEDEDELVESES